jgi:hypothetical protein
LWRIVSPPATNHVELPTTNSERPSVYTSELIELEFEELTPFKESLERLFSLVIGNTKNLYLKEKVEVYKNIELEWE